MRRAQGEEELAGASALRRRVFCGEQGVPVELEVDGRDEHALHLVALRDDIVVGTCRLLWDGTTAKLGRMAVAARLRRRGVGAAILQVAEREARDAGAERISLAAQSQARGLYERYGYAPHGEVFEEAGIEHVAMEKRLA